MPQLSIPLLPAGAFLDVGVGASRNVTGPRNRPSTWRALIDTGASITVVSPPVLSRLKPRHIGYMPVRRAGGVIDLQPTYDLRIRFGGNTGPGRWYTVEAAEILPATPDIDVLIGVDLLVRIDMVWSGSGRVVLLNH